MMIEIQIHGGSVGIDKVATEEEDLMTTKKGPEIEEVSMEHTNL